MPKKKQGGEKSGPISMEAPKEISASEFKTHCLELMDRVNRTHEEITITKYGRPVAKLIGHDAEQPEIFGFLSGTVTTYGDLVSPIDEPWDADA